MGNRTLNPNVQTYGGPNVVYAEFELLGGGAGNPLTLSTDAKLIVNTVTRSSAGVYVVTLKDAYTKLVYKSIDLDDTLNDGGYATCGSVTNEGTSTPIVFTIYTRAAAGTVADAALNRRVSVSLRFRNGLGSGVA